MRYKNNPCLKCYFDWKDYCDDERRKACAEKAKEVNNSENKLVLGGGIKLHSLLHRKKNT